MSAQKSQMEKYDKKMEASEIMCRFLTANYLGRLATLSVTRMSQQSTVNTSMEQKSQNALSFSELQEAYREQNQFDQQLGIIGSENQEKQKEIQHGRQEIFNLAIEKINVWGEVEDMRNQLSQEKRRLQQVQQQKLLIEGRIFGLKKEVESKLAQEEELKEKCKQVKQRIKQSQDYLSKKLNQQQIVQSNIESLKSNIESLKFEVKKKKNFLIKLNIQFKKQTLKTQTLQIQEEKKLANNQSTLKLLKMKNFTLSNSIQEAASMLEKKQQEEKKEKAKKKLIEEQQKNKIKKTQEKKARKDKKEEQEKKESKDKKKQQEKKASKDKKELKSQEKRSLSASRKLKK